MLHWCVLDLPPIDDSFPGISQFEVQHYPGGRTFSQPADREEWKARLQELFPDEVKVGVKRRRA